MIKISDIINELNIKTPIYTNIQEKIALWNSMYQGNPVWVKDNIKSLMLPSSIAGEFARLTLTEFVAEIEENSYINKQFSEFLKILQNSLEYVFAVGGVVWKPYISGDKILVNSNYNGTFYPIEFDSNSITSAVFVESKSINENIFHRLEYHQFNSIKSTHTITQYCFRSNDINVLGQKCSLRDVEEWANLKENRVISNVEYPLFCYFKPPISNFIDTESPLGVSIYAKSVDLIRQADKQWERIDWEFESSERAINASEDLFRFDSDNTPMLPQGRERMYRIFSDETSNSKKFFETFSPEIREQSLYNGLNRIFQRIEFNCGLAYGTLSDLDSVEKTAEEIKTSKHRSYEQISRFQDTLKKSLEHLVYIISIYSKDIEKSSDIPELTITFGDGVLEDVEKEFTRRLQLVTSGLLSKEKFIAWYFGCSEEEALKYIPNPQGLFEGNA